MIISNSTQDVKQDLSWEYTAELWGASGVKGQGGLPGLVKATSVQLAQPGQHGLSIRPLPTPEPPY